MKISALLAVLAMPAIAEDSAQFQTPSGNIHCVMYSDDPIEGPAAVRCDMIELTQTHTQPPPGCDLDYGTSFYVAAESDTGGLSCHGDTIIMPSMDKLAYGSSLTVDGITCTSARTGLTCTNLAGHGFTLTRARQRLF